MNSNENQMSDREKVIAGLECCISGTMCSKCPYKVNNECVEGGYFYSKAINDAIEILKSQKPKPVKAITRNVLYAETDDGQVYEKDTFYMCPSCNITFSRTHKYKDIYFCKNCGQSVTWEDDADEK